MICHVPVYCETTGPVNAVLNCPFTAAHAYRLPVSVPVAVYPRGLLSVLVVPVLNCIAVPVAMLHSAGIEVPPLFLSKLNAFTFIVEEGLPTPIRFVAVTEVVASGVFP